MIKHAYKFLIIFSYLGVSIGFLGCPSRFDVEALNLNPKVLIDYGAMAKANQMPPGTRVYGLLRSGASNDARQQVQGELAQVIRSLNLLADLPEKSADLDPFILKTRKDLTIDVGPKADAAMSSSVAALALAAHVSPYVKDNSPFREQIKRIEGNMPPSTKASFETLSKRIVAGFERLYQMGVVYAQAKAQSDVNEQVNKIGQVLDDLKRKVNSETIMSTAAATNQAKNALDLAENSLNLVRNLSGRMTTPDMVGSGLQNAVTDLRPALAQLRNYYVNNISDETVRAQIDEELKGAEENQKALVPIVARYLAQENAKQPADPKLKELVLRAFSGDVAASVSAVKISEETDLNHFMRDLSANKILAYKQDEASREFMEALGVAVSGNVAPLYGLNVDNVYEFSGRALLDAKNAFSMSEEDFGAYVASMAKKAYDDKSKKDTSPNVFVVFLDQLGPSVDATKVAKILAQGKSRVVLVTKEPALLKDVNKSFFARGLGLPDGFFVAKATIEAQDSQLNASAIAEPLVKMFYALSLPDQMNLVSLPKAAKDAVLRLGAQSDPSTSTIIGATKEALASSKVKVPVDLVATSGVLAADWHEIERKTAANRAYYLDRGRGIGSDIDVRLQEIEQQRRATQHFSERASDAALESKAKDLLQEMKDALAELTSVVATKRTQADEAISRINQRILAHSSAIRATLGTVHDGADKCTVAKKDPPEEWSADAGDRFTAVIRQAWLNGTYGAAAGGSPEAEALLGKPNLAAAAPDNGWISCVVFGEKKAENVGKILQSAGDDISSNLNLLMSASRNCLAMKNFRQMQSCLQDAQRQFNNFRRSLATNDKRSLYLKVSEQLTELPQFLMAGAPSPLEKFWYQVGGAKLAWGLGANTLGEFISSNAADNDLRIAYRRINRNYYFRHLLEIIGTDKSEIRFENNNYSIVNDPVNPIFQATPLGQRFSVLRGVFDDWGGAVELVEARRQFNHEYDKIVARAIAEMLLKDVATVLQNSVVKPFWTMKAADLKLFELNGAGSAENQAIWTQMAALAAQIMQLKNDLSQNFVLSGDGNTTVQPTAALDAVAQHYSDLLAQTLQLSNAFNAAIAAGFAPGPIGARIASMNASLTAFNTANDLGANQPWINAAAPFVAPPNGVVARQFWKAYLSAWDIANFNYFGKGGNPLDPANPRIYPVWHPGYQAGLANPFWPDYTPDPRYVKHPLEP